MKMIGRDGQLHEVPDDQVQASFLSGQYGFTPGSSVPVVSQSGQVGQVNAEDAQQAFTAGARLAAPEEVHKATLEQQYGGVKGALVAAGEGAARGATMGLSDPLAIAAGGLVAGAKGEQAVREHLSQYKEVNPTAETIGQIAGMAVPIIASGGTAGAAEAGAAGAGEAVEGAGLVSRAIGAIGAPSRAVNLAGELAEKATAAAIGTGSERAFLNIAQKALTTGARWGAENALMGVGQQISEDALGDHELTAEKLYAAAGHAAVTGFLLGAAGGAAGKIAEKGIAALSPGLQSLAESQAVRALNPKIKNVSEIEKTLPGGTKGLGRWLLDNGVVQAGDTVEDVAAKLPDVRAKTAAKLDTILDTLDQNAVSRPDAIKITNRIRKEVLEPLASKPGFENIGKSVSDLNESFLGKALGPEGVQRLVQGEALPSKLPLGFRQLRDMRAAIDDLLYRESSPLAKSPRDYELRKVRSIIEDELEKSADKASETIGGGILDAYKDAKTDFRFATTAEKIANKETDRLMANRVLSPTDYLVGASALASGHPVGALGALAHHYVREHGNATAAAVLDKLASIGAIAREQAAINKQIQSGVQAYVHQTSYPVSKKVRAFANVEGPAGEAMRETYDRKVEEIASAAARISKDKGALTAAMQSATAHAPKIAGAVALTARKATQYLATQIPHDKAAGTSLQPQFDTPRVSDADAASFLRKAQVVEDPLSVLDELHRGTLTREHVEAIKTVYPKLYGQLVATAQNEIVHAEKPLPYDRLLQLHTLFGIPADKTMTPQFGRIMQATFQNIGSKKGGGKGRSAPLAPKRPVQGLAESFQLSIDRSLDRHQKH